MKAWVPAVLGPELELPTDPQEVSLGRMEQTGDWESCHPQEAAVQGGS